MSILSWIALRLRSLSVLRSTVITVCLAVAALRLFEDETILHSGRDKFATEIIRPVQPGSYSPHKCAAWNFLPDSEALLQTFSEALLRHAEGELLTSHHLSIPVCLLAFSNSVLINPQLGEALSQPRTLRTRYHDLCNASAPAFESQFSDAILLSYQDAAAMWHSTALNGTEALRIQKALRVLEGSDICDSRRLVV